MRRKQMPMQKGFVFISAFRIAIRLSKHGGFVEVSETAQAI